MDKLEQVWRTVERTERCLVDTLQIKADNAANDAIIDDAAGQAYVEQFALETFRRADRAVQANKVTKYGWLKTLELA